MTARIKPTVILFARHPQWGAGKRRLAACIGNAGAWRFVRAQLARLHRQLAQTRRWRLCWAVTPGRFARGHDRRLAQGPGDLGQRMCHALATLSRRGPAVLVGADIPAVTAGHIAAAFAGLKRHHLVFGPASDGGFWLIGLRRRLFVPRRFLQGCRWSSPHALADAVATRPGNWRVGAVATLDDVDDGDDYRAEVQRTLTATGAPMVRPKRPAARPPPTAISSRPQEFS